MERARDSANRAKDLLSGMSDYRIKQTDSNLN